MENTTTNNSVSYAGFWIRFIAIIIDTIIIAIVTAILGAIISGAMGPGGASTTVSMIVNLITGIAYFAGMESSDKMATIGKQAFGLRVTDMNGHRISFGRAVGRYLAKIISGIILLIGYIMAAFTKKNQALHDMIAGTLVVKVAKK